MSGSGRKTNYRKGVTKKVLYDVPEPKENEQVVQVVGLRGSNLFEVQDEHGETSVTMLPTKYRKLIWVKRGTVRSVWTLCVFDIAWLIECVMYAYTAGDFLIVGSGEAEASTAKGKKKAAVTSIVEHILYKDQIKNLKSKNLWPESFEKQESVGDEASTLDGNAQDGGLAVEDKEQEEEEEEEKKRAPATKSNGITMLDTNFADMYLNRNRRKGVFDEDEDEDSD